MPVIYDEKNQQFHLYNNKISYVLRIMPNKQLAQIYFGSRIAKLGNTLKFFETAYRDMSPVVSAEDITFSLDQIKQECSIFGKGDLRKTAFKFDFSDGSHVTEFEYLSHEIFSGTRELEGLPSIQTELDEEGTSLWIKLKDQYSSLEITCQYTLMENDGMLVRSYKVTNFGNDEISLDSALSVSLDLPDANYEMLMLTGAWCRERHIEKFKLHRGQQQISSLRGHSSHQFNPFFALQRPNTTENSGDVFGFSLIYSGNFIGEVDVDNYDVSRVLMGINPTGFNWILGKNDSFQTPQVAMVYSTEGLNGMSQTFHRIYRNNLMRKPWKKGSIPILINTWEATYMDFTEEKLLEIATESKNLGIDLFVLDDGWFGKRDSPKSSLGDWYPNLSKLPNGLVGLSRKLKKIGLKFGLWFEPEMISENSDLYAKHPEWLLSSPDRSRSIGRYQYYLDFSKEEVVTYLYEKISTIIEEANLSYIKWDLNRSMSEVYSQGTSADQQGKVYHKAVLGMYQLHEKLLSRFPELLIESCASGGARFDPGMIYYAPQGWASDNTDAVDRLKIQYGTSLVYPLTTIGSHVSAVPNHQTKRETSLEFRGDVAYFGTFGYELDVTKLTDEERNIIKQQIQFMKESQKLIQEGTFYRLISPFETNQLSWLVVSEDKHEALLGVYQLLHETNGKLTNIKLMGVDAEAKYQLTGSDYQEYFFGSELMTIGIPMFYLFNEESDFSSKVIKIVKVSK